MDFILKILGGLFLAILVLVGAGVLFLRYKLRKLGRMLSELAEQVQETAQPARVRLIRVVGAETLDALHERAAAVLAPLDFQPAGVFEIAEVPGVRLSAWTSTTKGMHAAFCLHPQAGEWVDFVTIYQDGTTDTRTNAPMGAEIATPPGHTRSYRVGADVIELYQWALGARPRKPTRALTAENLVSDFETLYANEMAWREARGPVTEDEVRAMLAAIGQKIDPTLVAAICDSSTRQIAIETQLVNAFRESSRLSPETWERVTNRLVFVHDGMNRDDVFGLFDRWNAADVDDEVLDALPDHLPARKTFERVNEALPAKCRFERIDQLAEPIAADVYVAPVTGAV